MLRATSRDALRWARALSLCVSLIFWICSPAIAGPGPNPPCAGPPVPAYAAPGLLPATQVWYAEDVGGSWRPPACTGWRESEFGILVAAAARFEHAGGAAALLERFGAISELKKVRYWSVTRKRWRELIPEARALGTPDADAVRPDFTADELRTGRALYFRQVENTPAGDVLYRMRLRAPSAGGLLLEIENVAPVRFLGIELFEVGGYQFLYFFEPETPRVWRYYGLMRTGPGSSRLSKGYEASFINRMAAIYRHFAGIPTDREPPAAP